MEGGGDALPADLRELAGKVGRRPPAGLLRGLRAEPAPAPPSPLPAAVRGARPPLADRLRALRLELVSAGARSVPRVGARGCPGARCAQRQRTSALPFVPGSRGVLRSHARAPNAAFP